MAIERYYAYARLHEAYGIPSEIGELKWYHCHNDDEPAS